MDNKGFSEIEIDNPNPYFGRLKKKKVLAKKISEREMVEKIEDPGGVTILYSHRYLEGKEWKPCKHCIPTGPAISVEQIEKCTEYGKY